MPQSIHSKIAGVTKGNRQQIIRDELIEGADLFAEREPDNRYDPNAILLLVDSLSDQSVGYINSKLAAELAPIMDAGGEVLVEVSEITGGGGEKETLGVNILLTVYSPEEWSTMFPQGKPQAPSIAPYVPPTPPPSPPKPARAVKPPPTIGKFGIVAILLGICFLCFGSIGLSGVSEQVQSDRAGYALVSLGIAAFGLLLMFPLIRVILYKFRK